MYVKLVHPCDFDKTLFFDVGNEFWPHPEDYPVNGLEAGYPDGAERIKRSLIHYSGSSSAPQPNFLRAVMFQTGNEDIYTNWTIYLLNNEGKTIERVFP